MVSPVNDSAISLVERQTTINGLDFAYLEAGSGPLALCMHGFPDTAYGWQYLLPQLAQAGFHAIAPFARGYAPTAVPEVGSSTVGAWVADINGFHKKFGNGEPGVLIGHDWGALSTYGAAVHEPDHWRRLVTAAVPPASVMAPRLTDFNQIKAFWYQWFFLRPDAEATVASDDMAFLRDLWAQWSPGFDATHALVAVRAALRDQSNLTAALEMYRETWNPSVGVQKYVEEQLAAFSPHTQPTLYLHGANDGCVPQLTEREFDGALPSGSRVEILENAGHFLHYEQPKRFNDLVLEFITKS